MGRAKKLPVGDVEGSAMKVSWGKGEVELHLRDDGSEITVKMKPQGAIALANALMEGGTQAWTGALTVPAVPVIKK